MALPCAHRAKKGPIFGTKANTARPFSPLLLQETRRVAGWDPSRLRHRRYENLCRTRHGTCSVYARVGVTAYSRLVMPRYDMVVPSGWQPMVTKGGHPHK